MNKIFWICDFQGLIEPIAVGSPSYAGSYRLVYFEGFKVLQMKKDGKWQFVNKILPRNIRSVYSAAKYLGV